MSPRPAIFLIIVLSLWGCAPPRFEKQQAVLPQKETLAVALAREGMAYFRAGRMPEAEMKFRQVLWMYPSAENVLYNLALTLARQALFPEAHSIYAGLLKKNPDSVDLLANIAESYFLAGDYQQAGERLRQAYALAEKKDRRIDQARLARSLSVLSFSSGNEDMLKHVRLLIALHLYRQAQETVSGLTRRAERRADAQSAYLLALADYGAGSFAEAVDRSETALAASAREAGMVAEFKLLRFLAGRHMAAGAGTGPADKVEAAKEERQELEAVVRQMFANPARLLFLPYQLLEELRRGIPQ